MIEPIIFVKLIIIQWLFYLSDIEEPTDGRVVFTKPNKKRKSEDSTGGIEASTKRTKSDKTVRRSSTSKKVKDTSLLSFDEDDETFS